MAYRHMRKILTYYQGNPSLIIREIQSKTIRYHLILLIMAYTKNNGNNFFCWGRGKKGILIHCCWECCLVQPLWKIVWRVLSRHKFQLPYDPAIPLSGIAPRIEARSSKRLHAHHSSLQHSLQWLRFGITLDVQKSVDHENVVYIYTQWNIPQL